MEKSDYEEAHAMRVGKKQFPEGNLVAGLALGIP